MFERAYDPQHRLVEHNADDALQDRVAEFEVHIEMHRAAAVAFFELPVGFHVLERAIEVFGVDLARVVPQFDLAGESLAEDLEADHQIRLHQAVIALRLITANARGSGPGQELRVTAHISHQIVHLLRGVRQRSGLGMGWHWRPGLVNCALSHGFGP